MTAFGSGWGQDKIENGLEVLPDACPKEEPGKNTRVRECEG